MKRLFSYLSPQPVFGEPDVAPAPLRDLLSENIRLASDSPPAQRRDLHRNRVYGTALDAAFRSGAFEGLATEVETLRHRAYVQAAYASHAQVLADAAAVSPEFARAVSRRLAEVDPEARAERRAHVRGAAAFGAVFRHGDATLSRATDAFDVLVAVLSHAPGVWGGSRTANLPGLVKPVAALQTADRVKRLCGATTRVAIFAEDADSPGVAFVSLSALTHAGAEARLSMVACQPANGLVVPVVRFGHHVEHLLRHCGTTSASLLPVIEARERLLAGFEEALRAKTGLEDALVDATAHNALDACGAARRALRALALCTLDDSLARAFDALPPAVRTAVDAAERGAKAHVAAKALGAEAHSFFARSVRDWGALTGSTMREALNAGAGID